MNYPANDTDFEDVTIAEVRAEEKSGGWSIKRCDGWSFFVPKDSPIAPAPGMAARFYGKGIGYTVRGVFLDRHEVFYRTEAGQRQHERDERYGKDAADLVRKWDADETIWSITLGGFGPSYEQALVIAAVEFARQGLDVPLEGDREKFYREGWDEVCGHALERIKPWYDGMSGAQYGAAKWLAWQWVHGAGPAFVADPKYDDRTIQVSRRWVAGCAAHALGVAEVGPADPWRPIDTAPKNGREVILREGDRVGAACWIKWPDTYDSDGAPNADGGEGWTIGWDGDEWREPDAWQPLPPAHGVTASPADLLKVAQAMQEELGLGSSRPMSLDDALDRAAGVPDLARGVTDALPFDREYVSGYLSEVLAEATGNADPEVQKLLAWLADGVLEAQGNRCGCNHWTTPKCPERNCPWQGKRPVDAGVAVVEAPSGGVVWTPEDETRLDAAIAKRNAARAAHGVGACSVPAIPQRETTPETPEFMPARGMGVAPAPRMLTFDEIDAVYEADRGNNNCFQTQARDLIRKFCEVNGLTLGVEGRTK